MLPQLVRVPELELRCVSSGSKDPDDTATNFRIAKHWWHKEESKPILDVQIVAHSLIYYRQYDIFVITYRDPSLYKRFGKAVKTFDRPDAEQLDLEPAVINAKSPSELIEKFSSWRDEPSNSNLLALGIEITSSAYRATEGSIIDYNAFVVTHASSTSSIPVTKTRRHLALVVKPSG